MIRFLVISSVFFLLYLGFSVLSQLDSPIAISAYDYFLETTFFTLVALFIVLLLVALFLLRIIFLVFELPHILRKRLHQNKVQKTYTTLLQALTSLIMNNKSEATEIIEKILPDLNNEHKELSHLILAEAGEEFDNKIQHLRAIVSSKEYGYFASARLAEIFLKHGLYQQAEEYGTRCYNFNEEDKQILVILLECYVNLNNWAKFEFIVSKLTRTNTARANELAERIGIFYVRGAKNQLEKGEDAEAVRYLETSLELYPYNLEAIDLYISLTSSSQPAKALAIIKIAFAGEPSFELAELYMELSSSPPNQIFDELAELFNPEEFPQLLRDITEYLELPKKAKVLPSSKC